MAETDRAVAHAVLDVLVAVDVPDAAAGAALYEARSKYGILVVALCVGVAAAGNQRVRSLFQTSRVLETPKLLHLAALVVAAGVQPAKRISLPQYVGGASGKGCNRRAADRSPRVCAVAVPFTYAYDTVALTAISSRMITKPGHSRRARP